MTHLITPTVNINGTSRDELVAQQRAVLDAVQQLAWAMSKANPHPRDFQLAPQEYIPARAAWDERRETVAKLWLELKAHALTISHPA